MCIVVSIKSRSKSLSLDFTRDLAFSLVQIYQLARSF
jgi:hypothetical protein